MRDILKKERKLNKKRFKDNLILSVIFLLSFSIVILFIADIPKSISNINETYLKVSIAILFLTFRIVLCIVLSFLVTNTLIDAYEKQKHFKTSKTTV